MKITLRGVKKINPNENLEIIQSFLKFLQKEIPLTNNFTLNFMEHRVGKMTTGMRIPNQIGILVKDRLLIDILRTISHEWVHEYQHQKLGVDDNSKFPDIGGPMENMSNVLSGIFIKKFEKEHPEFKKVLYGE